MQRAEYQVPGKGGLDGNFSRLNISDLTDENHVGVLPQDSSKARSERNADAVIDRDLHNAVDVVLHRIFRRNQLVLNVVHLGESGVQRGGLARARRAGDQHDPIRTVHDLAEVIFRRLVHPHFIEGKVHHGSVENPHNDTLAKHGWEYRDAQVHRVTTDHQFNPTVLRKPAFGDVEVRHNLDSRGDRKGEVARRRNHFIENSFGLDPNSEFVFEWFEVDIASVVFDRQ